MHFLLFHVNYTTILNKFVLAYAHVSNISYFVCQNVLCPAFWGYIENALQTVIGKAK